VEVSEREENEMKALTGRMIMWAGLIPSPSGPRFAIADIARIAIDDAVSNPGCAFSHGPNSQSETLHQNRTVSPPDTSVFDVCTLSRQVKPTLTFQGRSTKVITGPIIFMSKVFL
jgi:hypothetical protein